MTTALGSSAPGPDDLLQILNSIRESVLITDTLIEPPGPRILYVNNAFERIYGYSAADVVGKTPRIFQGADTDRAVLDELRSCLTRGVAFTGETVNYRKDGSRRTVRWYIEPLLKDGALYRWMAVQRDVTEQREAERFAGRLLDAMAAFEDGAMLLDDTGSLQFVNEPFCRFLDRPHASEEVGSPACSLLPLGDSRDAFEAALRDRNRWRGDIAISATGMILETHLSPLKERSISDGGYVCTARDVTEQRRAERMSSALSFSDNLGFIFAGIRHELGNPINSLKSALTVLRPNLQRFGPEKVDSYLSQALEEVERVEYLLGALRSYGSLALPKVRALALDEWIPRFVHLLDRDLASLSVRLEVRVQPSMTVLADERALHHAFINLIRNSVEAMGESAGRIVLSARRRESWVEFLVTDDGPGMTEEEAERALLPFHTTKGSGSGMGLVIVQRLVSNMGGTLEIASQIGNGTTMTVLLPAVE